MQIQTNGLIIMEKSVGESDRLITALTQDEGVLRAFAQRAKKLKSSKLSATQLFSYSRLNIYKGRDKYIINDAQPIEVFFDLRRDIERLSLAQYFCELACTLAPQEAPAGDFLRLMLNSFYFLSKNKRPNDMIKAIVEMRMLSLAGYMPNLVCCADCSCYEAEKMYFLPQSGLIYCEKCIKSVKEPSIELSRGSLTAMRHIIYSEFQKLFSFSLSKSSLKEVSFASEKYVLYTLGRSFNTLEFYHKVKSDL